ncbi:MAG: ATP-binding protein, partial [Thermoplasmata archaeon]|nr:ATP-binding protein [Thermoplasmata archaeon]
MAASGVDRPFVGRLEVLDSLRRRRDLARDGRGGVTLVEGNAGVGKSTLIEQLAHEAHAKGLRVVLTRTPSLESPPPLQLFRSVIAQAKTAGAESDEDDADTGLFGMAAVPTP